VAEARALVITVDGKDYVLRSGELTAIDARDFHAAIGQRLLDVFRRGPQDLDEIAGLVWIVRRRKEPGMPFEVVANAISYDAVLKIDNGSSSATEDPADPET
jgi:hypothetical protein